MTTYLYVQILLGDQREVFATMAKKVRSDAIPIPGMEIDDLAFGEGERTPDRITVDLDDGSYAVYIPPDTIPTKRECELVEERYRAHSWMRAEELAKKEAGSGIRFFSTDIPHR